MPEFYRFQARCQPIPPSSGLDGCVAERVLPVLKRACIRREYLNDEDPLELQGVFGHGLAVDFRVDDR
jgi:hypothetical protein